MRGTSISTFEESDEFLAAMREAGYQRLLVLEGGVYRARKTTLASGHLRLSRIEERQPRIALISLPRGLIRVVFPPPKGRLLCSGIIVPAGGFITHRGARLAHERVDGPCEWRQILAPVRDLAKYGRALTGAALVLPDGVSVWRPRPRAQRALVAL